MVPFPAIVSRHNNRDVPPLVDIGFPLEMIDVGILHTLLHHKEQGGWGPVLLTYSSRSLSAVITTERRLSSSYLRPCINYTIIIYYFSIIIVQ